MLVFLIDEDLPRSTSKELTKLGHKAHDDIYGRLIIVEPGRIRLHKVS